MTSTIEAARLEMLTTYAEHYDPERFGPIEACMPVNDASRKLVETMVGVYGTVWLGVINPWRKDDPPLRPYRGPVELSEPVPCNDGEWMRTRVGIVYNFGANLVVPKFDEKLMMMLTNWKTEPGAATGKNIKAISDRVRELGGYLLDWS